MKLRKIMAGVVATSIAATMAVAASAENTAFLMYAAGGWSFSCFDYTGHAEDSDGTIKEWNPTTVDVSKDGTYTVAISDLQRSGIDEESGDEIMYAPVCEGAVVFNVDIDGLADALGVATKDVDDLKTGADKMNYAKEKGINVTDVKITQVKDGETTEVAVDSSKILFGDIEGNGKLRIEFYNEYGDTKADPSVNLSDIYFNESLSVTFTITGIDAILGTGEEPTDEPTDEPTTDEPTEEPTDEPIDTPTTGDSTKPSTDTGVEGIAAVAAVAVLAAGAVVVAKKRK